MINALSSNLKTYLILSTLALVVLAGCYIVQVNSLAREIYNAKKYEAKLISLMQENETLEINFSKVTSLANVDIYLGNQVFEKVSNVKYIQILDASVAIK